VVRFSTRRESHLQNLPCRHPAVAVFFDKDEFLRIGQAGRPHEIRERLVGNGPAF
jgi:hypothetical protein